MKIIPAIDICDGKCVRLYQGDYAKVTEYSNNPAAIAEQFARLRVDDLHIVDLDGARTGTQKNAELVAAIARRAPFATQLGGGIRSAADARMWLDRGISRCVVGSMAIQSPQIFLKMLHELGGEQLVLALDIDLSGPEPLVATQGWTELSDKTLWACLEDFVPAGLQHVLCTDISRDGAMTGPNVALYVEIIERFPELALQASGGVRHLQDLEELRAAGIPAAITGRALLDGHIAADEVASFQQSA